MQPEQDDTQEVEADERVRGFFRKVAGEDLEIDWKELQDVLNFALKRGQYVFHQVMEATQLKIFYWWHI